MSCLKRRQFSLCTRDVGVGDIFKWQQSAFLYGVKIVVSDDSSLGAMAAPSCIKTNISWLWHIFSFAPKANHLMSTLTPEHCWRFFDVVSFLSTQNGKIFLGSFRRKKKKKIVSCDSHLALCRKPHPCYITANGTVFTDSMFIFSIICKFVLCTFSNGNQGKSPGNGKGNAENDKRLRREIANSNERRRMQSINAGFQSLKTLLPHHDGEKLSKVKSFVPAFFRQRKKNWLSCFRQTLQQLR